MANFSSAGHAMTRDLKWSHTEKGIARKAFERALERECRAVIRAAKEMAGKIEQPADLWDLESYLTKSRNEIDRKYDYRYSVLTDVFGKLVREGRLSEEELRGSAAGLRINQLSRKRLGCASVIAPTHKLTYLSLFSMVDR